MKYILLWSVLGVVQPEVGPFLNVFACEKAADQVKLLSAYPKKTATVCIDLNAKPHHWNGKGIPK